MDSVIVKEEFGGVNENNAIIKADVRDMKYCLLAEKYFEEKKSKNEEPDFDEWFFEHNMRLDKLKEDLVKFYELTHLPEETTEKVFQFAWDLTMENYEEDIDNDEAKIDMLEELVDRFADVADLFKI